MTPPPPHQCVLEPVSLPSRTRTRTRTRLKAARSDVPRLRSSCAPLHEEGGGGLLAGRKERRGGGLHGVSPPTELHTPSEAKHDVMTTSGRRAQLLILLAGGLCPIMGAARARVTQRLSPSRAHASCTRLVTLQVGGYK